VSVRILQLFPDVFDVNGDAQNALVLAQRLRWAGIDAEIATEATQTPDLIVVGSGVDTGLAEQAVRLRGVAPRLIEWVDGGVGLLAVGTGFELLSTRVGDLEGIGIFDGVAAPLAARATTDLVVDSAFGRLVGFENHARGWTPGARPTPLGTVVAGHGNDGRTEGARTGNAWGTHLHGPVLAKNPVFADAILAAVISGYTPDDDRIRFADAAAEGARNATLAKLKLTSGS
jgi:CobQ-like glutamine amidotransferase family enzyme